MKADNHGELNDKYSFHYDDPGCYVKIEEVVHSFMLTANPSLSREIIYLCVGTDRATGDCLGPLVGSRLKNLAPSARIYGTLEKPVHAANLENSLEQLVTAYNHPLIVAVDACLGKAERIGFINVKNGGLRPGTALGKNLPEVGEFHISGIVNVGGFLEYMVLQNTRLHIVYKMSEIIARGLSLAHFRFDSHKLSGTRESILSSSSYSSVKFS